MRRAKNAARIPAASEPSFLPQWTERALEREMRDEDVDAWMHEPPDECRLCACTDYSACWGGCSWVEGDLCSSCEDLMDAWPVLRLADGHGIAASWAFAEASAVEAPT